MSILVATETCEFSIEKDLAPLLSYTSSPILFEVGAHRGSETIRFLNVLGECSIHAFEPDPENFSVLSKINLPPCVYLQNLAISDKSEEIDFWKASNSYSGSIKKPHNVIAAFPDISFASPQKISAISIDKYCQHNQIDKIDFIWADVQGAEKSLLQGMAKMAARTNFIYTEFNDGMLYCDQPKLEEILDLIPSHRVFRLFHNDVLLINMHPNFAPV